MPTHGNKWGLCDKSSKKRLKEYPAQQCSEIIGVDDWAYKKGRVYGTIICNEKTHQPIEILPEAIQVADRFHLYQNLMETVKEALKAEFPEKTKIDAENVQECCENKTVKKTSKKK